MSVLFLKKTAVINSFIVDRIRYIRRAVQNVERFIYLVAKRIRFTHACTSAKISISTSLTSVTSHLSIFLKSMMSKITC